MIKVQSFKGCPASKMCSAKAMKSAKLSLKRAWWVFPLSRNQRLIISSCRLSDRRISRGQTIWLTMWSQIDIRLWNESPQPYKKMQCAPRLVQTLSKATEMRSTLIGARKLRSSLASRSARHPTQEQKKRRKRRRRRNTLKTVRSLMTDGSVGAIVPVKCHPRAKWLTRRINRTKALAITWSSPH